MDKEHTNLREKEREGLLPSCPGHAPDLYAALRRRAGWQTPVHGTTSSQMAMGAQGRGPCVVSRNTGWEDGVVEGGGAACTCLCSGETNRFRSTEMGEEKGGDVGD